MTAKQINLKLIEVPTASLRIDGKRLGTDRTRTPVPTQAVLLPSLEGGLKKLGYDVNSGIINMKLGEEESREGKIYLQGLPLEKYVIGVSFTSVEDELGKADVIGLTSNFTYSAGVVGDFIRYARDVNPKLKIVVGGADASVRQDFYLNAGADVVISGEGEKNGHLAIDALLRGGEDLGKIARVAFRRGNQVIKTTNGLGGGEIDMDELPLPALDRIDLSAYIDTGEGPLVEGASPPIWAYETSRGCRQACPFCTTPILKGNYRKMSLKRIEQYLSHIKKAGVNTIISNEDNPLSRMHIGGGYKRDKRGREEVLAYAKLIQDTGLAFEWANGLEIGKLADEKGNPDLELIIALLSHKIDEDGKFSGTYRCYIPLEALTNEGIEKLRKLRDFDTEKRVLEAIAEVGIPMLNFGVMVGAPNESPESIDQTTRRCYEIKELFAKISPDTILYFNFFMFTPLPGTYYFKRYRHRMIADVNTRPELWNFYVSCIDGDHYSAKDMTLLRRKISKEINGTHAMWVYDRQ